MGFPKIIYEKAAAILANRRQLARDTSVSQKKEIYSVIPELQNIDDRLAQIGMRTIQAVAAAPDNIAQIIERLKNESLQLQERRKYLLKDASLEEEYFKVPYSCKLCNDTGYVANKRCKCFELVLKQIAYKHLGAAQIGQYKFSNFYLDYYSKAPALHTDIIPFDKMTSVKNTCIEYAKNFSENSSSLLFIGGTGLGKTHLSLAIAEQVIAKGYGVVYSSSQNIMAKLEKEKFSYDRNYNEANDSSSYQSMVLECDLLIIDDLGTEFLSSFVNSMIYNIINTRLIEQRPCIISTNLEIPEIGKRYSERLVSRILGSYTRLDFRGADVRIRKGVIEKL